MEIIDKKLETDAFVSAWTYEQENFRGINVGLKNTKVGGFDSVFYIESIRCAEGLVNRIVINKTNLKKAGFVIVEE